MQCCTRIYDKAAKLHGKWTQILQIEWEIERKCKVAEEISKKLQSCMINEGKSSNSNGKWRKCCRVTEEITVELQNGIRDEDNSPNVNEKCCKVAEDITIKL